MTQAFTISRLLQAPARHAEGFPGIPSLCPVTSGMSSELLVDLGEDPATAQLGQLKLSTLEDQHWPPDEATLRKSGEPEQLVYWYFPLLFFLTRCMCFRDGRVPGLRSRLAPPALGPSVL